MIFSKEKKNWKKLLKINFLRKIRYPPPIFRVFYMNFIHNFSYSGNRGTQHLAFDAFFWIFLNFFFFAKNQFFFLESWLNPAMLGHFTLILLLNFHILAIKGHQTRSPREILTLPFMTEIWHKNVSPGTPETPISGL